MFYTKHPIACGAPVWAMAARAPAESASAVIK